MKSKAPHHGWLEELGATSRGMLFLGGSFATVESLQAADGGVVPRDGQATVGTRGVVAAALAAALTVAPALGWLADNPTGARTDQRIVDLPTITVRPSAADAAAYRHSRRIVDLDRVVVRPRATDRDFHLAKRESRLRSLASINARP